MAHDDIDPSAVALARASHSCLDCRHYFITWDASFPYGCRLMGFKSRRLPSQEVLEATGGDCLGFQARPAAARRATPTTHRDGTG